MMYNSRDAAHVQNDIAQLFVDDAIASSKVGIVRTLHPGHKLESPVLVPDRPWEGDRVYIYGTVLYDRDAQLFRMWYLTRLGEGAQRLAPGLRWPYDMVLYATSHDGIHWEKPNLGLHEFDGSRDNNILILNKHSPTLVIDEEEPDPEHRYRMAAWDWSEGMNGYWIAHSADGLAWHEYPVNPILVTADEVLETITVAREPRSGKYLAFHRRWGKDAHGKRLIAVATSQDFQMWSDPQVIIRPDDEDDVWTQDPEQRTELYGMAGFCYGAQFLGFLPVFRVVRHVRRREPGSDKSVAQVAPWDGPIEAQLVHSRDGCTWHRFVDRSPIIPRGEPGSFDAGCILCSADRPVVYDDEVWHYYTGVNTTHGGRMPPKRISIGRASWRLDGFVSLDAGPLGGVIETVPLQVSRARLEVNANAAANAVAVTAGGSLEVEVLSAAGEPLPGYGRGDCMACYADEVRHAVRWQGTDRLPTGQPIRLRFYLQDAALYSFSIRA
jgi:hypothetical protein